MTLTCPYEDCYADVEIADAFSGLSKHPFACPHCKRLLELEYDENYDGDGFFWLARME